jgi:predicted DNA binding CopG/RHH family protein
VQDIGDKERRSMKKKIIYNDAPEDLILSIEKSKRVKDFLPPPEDLILKEKKTRITIALSEKSVSFFKRESKKNGIPYQTMINKVLDLYADMYSYKK